MLKMAAKKILKSKIFKVIINSWIFNNYKIRKGNHIVKSGTLKHCSVFISGINNVVNICEDAVLRNCTIKIFGDDNNINIGRNVSAHDLNLWIEDRDNRIEMGDYTTVHGRTHIACIEGTSITIGSDCMFSSNISIVTGDSHSILDETGTCINPSRDIIIGNHVWIGKENTILKGAMVRDNSIIGAKSLVTKTFNEENVIITGNPARIIKTNINWSRERI